MAPDADRSEEYWNSQEREAPGGGDDVEEEAIDRARRRKEKELRRHGVDPL